jgi:hypothetical protein
VRRAARSGGSYRTYPQTLRQRCHERERSGVRRSDHGGSARSSERATSVTERDGAAHKSTLKKKKNSAINPRLRLDADRDKEDPDHLSESSA